ncbi:vasopressin V1a receptor-like [Liolophura sinensis]|uniref:vasopressin V1a receptor-like n=1 Tax=Liolophura sinensis TaxID=3198878 RepID=UPI0031590C76
MSLSTTDEVLLVASLSVYSVVGVTGNVLILLVYHRKSAKLSLVSFIRLLGIVDLLVCALIIPYTITFELHYVQNDFTCRLFEFVRHFTVLASNATLLAIAVERYYAVCRPLQRLEEEQIAKGVTVIAIVSLLMALPSVFMFAVLAPEVDSYLTLNQTGTIPNESNIREFCHFTPQYLGENGTLLYQGFLVFLFFGGVIVLIIFYSLVYTAVWKRTKTWKLNQVVPTSAIKLPSTFFTIATIETGCDAEPSKSNTTVTKESPCFQNRSNFLTVPSFRHDESKPVSERDKVLNVPDKNEQSISKPKTLSDMGYSENSSNTSKKNRKQWDASHVRGWETRPP